MADIFVSYASGDRERVRGLVDLFESAGWSVWWDRSMHAGDSWPDRIQRELERAKCVVVVWSRAAIDSHWVRLEAHAARQRRILVPVAIDDVAPPAEFTTYQTLTLHDYPREAHERELAELSAAVSSELHRARRRKLVPWIASLVLAIPVVGGICWGTGACDGFLPAGEVASVAPPENSIAILQFEFEGSEDEAYVASGFVELVAMQLQSVGYLVASRVAVEALPERADVELIRNRLRVRWLLDGTLTQSSEGLKVTAQLVDLETGYRKQTWTFDANLKDMVAMHNQFARTVLGELDVPVLAMEENWSLAPNVQSQVYLLYLRGLDGLGTAQSLADINAAEKAFADAVRMEPDFALAHAGLCRAKLRRYEWLRSTDQFREAEMDCERASALNPTDPQTSLALGWLQYYSGAYTRARDFFEMAVSEDASSADALIGLARALEALGNPEAAGENFSRATVVQPGYWQAHNQLAMFLVRRGRRDEAVARFEVAVEMVPNNPTTLGNLGAALIYADELGLAVQALDAALKIEEDASLYSNLGAVYYLLRDYIGAAQAYERAVELSADDYRLHANLADSLTLLDGAGARQHYESALELAEDALAVNPDDAQALAGAGAFHAVLGDALQALELTTRAVELSPDDPEVRRLAAITFVRLGDADGAIEQIAKAVDLGYPPAMVARDGLLDPLREREEFVKIVDAS